MTRVLIIDDRELVRQGLRRILSAEHRALTFFECAKGDERLAHLIRHHWGLMILTVGTAGADGFEILGKIRDHSPDARILVMSPRTDYLLAFRAKQLGATGYAGEDTNRDNFVCAVRNVLKGQKYFGGFAIPANVGEILPGLAKMSSQEFRVLLALGAGKRPAAIASEFELSVKTISTYKRRILDKLQARSIADLVRYMIR